MRDIYFSWGRCWRAFGNGDETKGRIILENLVTRIEEAREKHSWGLDKETDSPESAIMRLFSEINEWYEALQHENDKRQLDEALDVLAVAVRMANQEYDYPR